MGRGQNQRPNGRGYGAMGCREDSASSTGIKGKVANHTDTKEGGYASRHCFLFRATGLQLTCYSL